MAQKTKGMKVLIGPSTFAELDSGPLNSLREAGCDIIRNPFRRKLTKEEALELLGDGVTGLIAGLEPLDREVLEKSKLKAISRCGAGLANVDLEAARELGIKVFSTPDAPTTAVAELTVGAILGLIRMVPQMDNALHQGKWAKKIGMQLEGKTVAIIGFGRIGRKVASLLKPFNVRIIAVDPALSGEVDGIRLFTLDRALAEADVITVHASGDSEIIGQREFKLIKRGAFLCNSARRGLINESAFINALEEKRIAGAWLDTFTEPYSGPLRKYPQVILTPHIGSYTLECRRVMESQAVSNLLSAFGKVK